MPRLAGGRVHRRLIWSGFYSCSGGFIPPRDEAASRLEEVLLRASRRLVLIEEKQQKTSFNGSTTGRGNYSLFPWMQEADSSTGPKTMKQSCKLSRDWEPE